MSRKTQQGAAEHPETGDGRRPGVFGRLRRQPGFRTAVIAFIVTVVLGLGGTAAYAYWSASTAATIMVTPKANLGTPPAKPVCHDGPLPNEIRWPAVTGADKDVVYLVSFTVEGTTKLYALPTNGKYVVQGNVVIQPATIRSLQHAFGQTTAQKLPLTVTLRTATVKPAVGSLVPITEADVIEQSAPQVLQMFYSTTFWGNFPCR